MVTAYIGLGSNLGDPVKNLIDAIAALDRLPGVDVVACSSFYRSRPMVELLPERHSGRQVSSRWRTRQPDYVNAVVMIETSLPPLQLLRRLQGVERHMGRLRNGVRWASRLLDLDLLLYGDWHIDLPRLVVPHAGIAERDFVLRPLAEIAAADMMIPGHGTLGEMLARVADNALEQIEGMAGR